MSDYLIHYGVKGMKWGVRKQRPYSGSRRAYKQANKDYSKAFNKAYNYSSTHMVRQFVKGSKWQHESDRRWADANDKAEAANKAKAKYKQEKKAYKESNPGMSTKKKVAIAASVVGVAAVGTTLAIYGKKQFGSLNPKKIAAGRELANMISGKNNAKALKSVKGYRYSHWEKGLKRYGRANHSQWKASNLYSEAKTHRNFKKEYERPWNNDERRDYYRKLMDLYEPDKKIGMVPGRIPRSKSNRAALRNKIN